MKEPRRWRDQDSDASLEARSLLKHARPTPGIDQSAFLASALRIAEHAAASPSGAGMSFAAKLVAASSVVGVAALSAALLWPHARPSAPAESERGPVPVSATTPATSADAPRAAPADQRSAGEVPPRAEEPPPRQRAASRHKGSSLMRRQAAIRSAPSQVSAASTSSSAGSATQTAMSSPTAATSADSAEKGALNQDVVPVEPPSSVRVLRRPALSPGPEQDALADELRLLDRARVRLERDPAGALAELERHTAQFPYGSLSAERELMAVDALLRLTQVGAAEQRARALLRRYPGSMYAQRVHALLARKR